MAGVSGVAVQGELDARVLRPRRMVVKLGTNVIMRTDGRIALGLVCGLVEAVAALRARGLEVLLVSSGAVGLGAERLGLSARPSELAEVQACAAVGQSRLMGVYEDSFARMGCRIAQVLLTEDDFRDAVRHANLRRTLLSDVDGLYDRSPGEAGACLVPVVEGIDAETLGFARGANGRGRGGMQSKLRAARIATDAGGTAVIANGRTPGVLERVLDGLEDPERFAAGTLFLPRRQPVAALAVSR